MSRPGIHIRALKSFKWPTDRPLLLDSTIDLVAESEYEVRAEAADSPGFCALLRNGCIEIVSGVEGHRCSLTGAQVLTRDDKYLQPSSTTVNPSDDPQTTSIPISNTPEGGGDVEIVVNGVSFNVCDGDIGDPAPFFFSTSESGDTVRRIRDITEGDILWVKGATLGFPMSNTDKIDLRYLVTASEVPGVEILTTADKDLPPIASAIPLVNGQDTGIAISATPYSGTDVEILLNGIRYTLGETATKDTADFYFSSDGGVTARDIIAINQGDELYVNCANLEFGLETSDSIDIRYVIESPNI